MLDRSNDQVAERLAKLEALRERGIDPYPYRFATTATIAGLKAAHAESSAEELDESPPRAACAGRVLAVRSHGKTGFLDVSDGIERLQFYVRRDAVPEEAFEAFRLVDIGDWVGAEGVLMRTRTGELSLRADDLTVLAKALTPLPVGKTEVVDGKRLQRHAVVDKEQRYRRRYVDLAVNPEVRAAFETRSRIIAAVRSFLDERGFLEVETPILQLLHGGASARPFKTHLNALGGLPLYLRIADELYLKRLIVGGIERVYEIAKDFRNEGIDRTHNPEFTMLELYQAYADYGDMATLTEELVATVSQEVLGTRVVVRDDVEIDLTPPWRRITMLEAIRDIGGVKQDLEAMDRDVLLAACRDHELETEDGDNAGQLLDLLFSELVQPQLVQPTFVLDYPKEISPLAKVHRSKPGLTERFEPFIAGWEIGNAFSELNDPVDQRQRFEAQMALRAAGDDEAQVLDEDFLTALEHGMPPTGGLGIGIDRLVMLLTGASSIRDVLFFPFMRPQTGDAARPEAGDVTEGD